MEGDVHDDTPMNRFVGIMFMLVIAVLALSATLIIHHYWGAQ